MDNTGAHVVKKCKLLAITLLLCVLPVVSEENGTRFADSGKTCFFGKRWGINLAF